jgi:hypothetical protein
MTYKPSKDGSTSTLLKHLNNKHSSLIEKKEQTTGPMDKFIEKSDVYVLYCIVFIIGILFYFIFCFYLSILITNHNFCLTEIYTRKLA